MTPALELGGEAAVEQHHVTSIRRSHDVRLRSMTTNTEHDHRRHRETLERALTAIRERSYWSAYPENLKAYGEESPARSRPPTGKAAFDGYLGKPFPLEQARHRRRASSGERSPYGIDLGISYPHAESTRCSRPPPPPSRPGGRPARTPAPSSASRSSRASTPAATRWRRP